MISERVSSTEVAMFSASLSPSKQIHYGHRLYCLAIVVVTVETRLHNMVTSVKTTC